jgi:RHS repeat-associated protein
VIYKESKLRELIKGGSTYLYDGSILLAEKVGTQIQKIYINDGQGIIGMVRPIYDGSNSLTHYQRLYYLYDSLGSVSAVTGEHGLPLQNYTYSPFGTCLNVTNDPINNLQFVGRYGGYLDNDTGLTYFWHRWYDSKDGRFISRDPIGIAGGKNVYGYVQNNAINRLDVSGLVMVPDANPWATATPDINPPNPPNPSNPTPTLLPPAPVCEKKKPTCSETFEGCCNGAYGNFVAWSVGKAVFDVACANACRVRCLGRPSCVGLCATACFLVGEQIPSLENYFNKLDKCGEDFTRCSKNR